MTQRTEDRSSGSTNRILAPRAVPRATYRLQFTPQFGFADARELLPYLERLGISDVYCSPILTARPGSTHGYDVVDPLHINPELGGQNEFDKFVAEARRLQISLLLDIVPNHMAASIENPWWFDVLEHGPSSRFAHFFDIEWDPAAANSGMHNRVLLPLLGSPYGETLENGEIRIEPNSDGYVLRYFEHQFPLAIESYARILGLRATEIQTNVGITSTEWQEFAELLLQINQTPLRTHFDESVADRRHITAEIIKERLRSVRRSPAIANELGRAAEIINGIPGDAASFDLLDGIVSMQSYRLAFWQIAKEQINYRRFFDINDLISMRVEDVDVFNATHERILDFVAKGDVAGLRVDHVDGLWNPQQYLERLQLRLAQAAAAGSDDQRFYVAVEKILGNGEQLPSSWPVNGTTGYDFLNVVGDLSIDQEKTESLDWIYQRTSGMTEPYSEIVYAAKRAVLDGTFIAYVRSLSVTLEAISNSDRHGRDLTFDSLMEALIEVTASLPVYRTYINDMDVNESDRYWIDQALELARRTRPDLRPSLAFLARVLLLQIPSYIPQSDAWNWLDFVMRWQQLCGPVMAKGNEDTALYRYPRLLSRNEVGGHPDLPPAIVDEVHAHFAAIAEHWPHTLNATSTHDTKRSEDVRSRIAVLSEIPEEWGRRLELWQTINGGKRPVRNAVPIPDGGVEMYVYQSMLGGWPLNAKDVGEFQRRLKNHLIKAVREAKLFTSWVEPDAVYEDALLTFVDSLFDSDVAAEFLDDFAEFQMRVARLGALNALSQTLIKFTAPGVPDTYQGNEIWDFSFVDPDNRRPVDYGQRSSILEQLLTSKLPRQELLADLTTNWQDGRIKLFLSHQLLALRRRLPELFSCGTYEPCLVGGQCAGNVFSYVRTWQNRRILVVAPILVSSVADDGTALTSKRRWGDTVVTLPPNSSDVARELFSEESVPLLDSGSGFQLNVSDALRAFPCAVLEFIGSDG